MLGPRLLEMLKVASILVEMLKTYDVQPSGNNFQRSNSVKHGEE
jgi:hypothetical protein